MLKLRETMELNLNGMLDKLEGRANEGRRKRQAPPLLSSITSLMRIKEMESETMKTRGGIKSTPRVQFLSNPTSRADSLVGEDQDHFGANSIRSEKESIESRDDSEKSEIFNIFGKEEVAEHVDIAEKSEEDLESEQIARLKGEIGRLRRRLKKYKTRTRNLEKTMDTLHDQLENCLIRLS